MPEPTLEDRIKENAMGPKRVQQDGTLVEQHPLKDQIDVARYTDSKAAARTGLGLRVVKLVPGDAD